MPSRPDFLFPTLLWNKSLTAPRHAMSKGSERRERRDGMQTERTLLEFFHMLRGILHTMMGPI